MKDHGISATQCCFIFCWQLSAEAVFAYHCTAAQICLTDLIWHSLVVLWHEQQKLPEVWGPAARP